MTILRLAIPSPLRRLFDYLPPSGVDTNSLVQGVRIRAPFGNREVIGILMEVTEKSSFPISKLKPALEILDNTPPLPQHLLNLIRWAASYYQHPEGDALQQALPVLLRKGNSCEYIHEHLWKASSEASLNALKNNAVRQQELLQLLLEHPQGISAYALRVL